MRAFTRFVALLGAAATLVSAQTNYPVTGVKVASGAEVPLRKPVDTLYNAGGPQWSIYLAALDDLYYTQVGKDQLSFFQIAGIHGRPYIEWNGAGPRTSNGWLGYCPHGEKLFLPWHRPYVLLFEQRLVETALKLANKYPSNVRAQYVKAAQTLRAPYWDWAATARLPQATVPNKMRITVPDGTSRTKTIEIDNPLRVFRFPGSALRQDYGSFSREPQINKCSPDASNRELAKRPYKQWTYDLFSRAKDYTDFASTGSSGISLEMIHNGIHWDGSCGNQFLDADYSGFDPLFMLHHANVDRLWAYWQFMKPQHATFQNAYSGGARFSTPGGTSIGPGNPLKPFFASRGNFHTSDSVKSIKKFGYTYEGLEYWRKSDSQMQRDATALINRLYGTGASSRSIQKRDDGKPVELTRYFAKVSVDVTELERPCAIDVFANTTSLGNFIVLGQPATGIFHGSFGLDQAADPIKLIDVVTDAVVGDLLGSLRVEIRKRDGTVIPLSTVPSFKLELENVEVIPPVSLEELPEYFDAVVNEVLDPQV